MAKGRECVSRKKTLASKPCWKHETIGTLAVGSSEKYPHQYMSAKKSISVSRLHLRILEDLTFFSTVGNSWCVVAGPQGESVDIWPVHLLGDVFSTRNRCSSVAMSIPKPSSCFTKDSCRRSSRRQTQLGGSRTFPRKIHFRRVGCKTLTRILFFLILGGIQYSIATMLPCSCAGI